MDAELFREESIRLMREVAQRMDGLFHPVCDRLGLTMAQFFLLCEVGKNPSVTVGNLSRRLRAANANTSSTCKRLEQAGFLERVRSSRDERVVHLSLTEQGREALLEADRLISQAYCQVLCRMGDAEQRQILLGLQGLSTLLLELQTSQTKEEP